MVFSVEMCVGPAVRRKSGTGLVLMTLIEIFESRKEALNVEQVAELLGVSEKKIYRLSAAGVLPSFRVGSAVRFDGQDMADWLRRKKPSDEQDSLRRMQKADGFKAKRNGSETVPPVHVWRDKIGPLEMALAMGSSAANDDGNSS